MLHFTFQCPIKVEPKFLEIVNGNINKLIDQMWTPLKF